jgi:dTDP-4-dehydrorhamnose reductase
LEEGLHSIRIVIVGAGGRLGAALLREYREQFSAVGFNHADLDLCDLERVRMIVEPLDFDLLINCAAQTNVDRCETHAEEAFLINADAPRLLAEICQQKSAKMIHVSTDYVFSGEKPEPYREEDPAEPISVYGESKRRGEELVLGAGDRHLVLRVSWVFGPDRPSFIDQLLQLARENEKVAAVADKFSTPTYTRDIAEMLRDIIRAGPGDATYTELLHFANSGQCSWREYTQWALDCCHSLGIPMKARKVDALSMRDMKNWLARRPIHTVLATAKYTALSGLTPRSWQEAVAEYVRDYVKGRNEKSS